MQNNSVADVLRSLASGDSHRSDMARLRDVFDEVENALRSGVRRAAILDALHDFGFTLTLKSFESALYRIRKQRQRDGQRSVVNAPSPTPEPVGDELSGLDKKQRREKLADQFITPESNNPLLKRIKEKKS